ncbi:hypothetical protein ADL21_11960 [Streptomyces albus subsp. albus]|nr:hypothetical protein ADL21_11960 [Streptomyces albus subsp. albus]
MLLACAVVLAAAALRPALTAVGPLAQRMAAQGMSPLVFASLTTLPLLLFAGVGPLTRRLATRWGIERVLAAALLAIAAGCALRWPGSTPLLLTGTAALGAGIVVANILLPSLVKSRFPDNVGAVTGLYTGTMALAGAAAAAAAVPLAGTSLGWSGSLGVWALPAAVAALAWVPHARGVRRTPPPAPGAASPTLFRSRLAWQITGYFAATALGFYICTAYLPKVLADRGLSEDTAGAGLATGLLLGAATATAVPAVAMRLRSPRGAVGILSAAQAAGAIGLLTTGGSAAAAFGILLLTAVSGAFALCFVLFTTRAPDPATATRLSAMAQSTGYLIGALGPLMFGTAHTLTGTWNAPLALLLAMVAAATPLGLAAGRSRRTLWPRTP